MSIFRRHLNVRAGQRRKWTGCVGIWVTPVLPSRHTQENNWFSSSLWEVQSPKCPSALQWRESKTNFDCSLCTILKHEPLKREAGIEKLGKYHSFLQKNKRLRTENPTTTLNANEIILILLSFGVSWESLAIQVRLAHDWETKIKLWVEKNWHCSALDWRWNTEDRLHSWAAPGCSSPHTHLTWPRGGTAIPDGPAVSL